MQAGTRWFWGSYEFVDFASNTAVNLPPHFWFPCLPFQTPMQQYLIGSAWISVDPCRGHRTVQPIFPSSGLMLFLPDTTVLAAASSRLNSSPGIPFAWRYLIHAAPSIRSATHIQWWVMQDNSEGSFQLQRILWDWLKPSQDFITVLFFLCPVLLTSLPHRYWSPAHYLLHTHIWRRHIS